ncbi:GntR family transcriptional regulator [Streptomyces melanosporofaciens]|uniref:DNA-binding transcriptional regulator, GntR family n=1 Tax=Streptomyces melanosporofaciens TaxID=67327 RepID=A0A1H4KLK5_STRMJ|nr:GntR family transcriptional regulator [Streptomyces melanosporofaciens]SEB59449.1 DNA-binding transcriptional regulator, GntR family [Streptomyces melanosporofaciens]
MTDDNRGLLVERPERLLRDRVTDVVREAIMRGDLKPGRRLTERELGELTGVSRTSLREALRSLQAEGLVERSGARGLQVAVLTAAVVSELYDVRAPLEAAAVELFIGHASDAQVVALRAATAPSSSGEFDDQLAATRRFYALLLDGAGNSILQQMFGSIEARIHALRRVSLRISGRAEASRRELLEIVDLIEQRNGPAAAAAARAHVAAAKAAALAALEGHGAA